MVVPPGQRHGRAFRPDRGRSVRLRAHATRQERFSRWSNTPGRLPRAKSPATVLSVIEVCEYDPMWAVRFDDLRMEYQAARDRARVPVKVVEHVGSTSVPGLAAKPVIDVDIVLAAEHVQAGCDALVELGFEPRGELGIPERWAFYAPEHLGDTNTYVIVAGSLSLRNHLAVRDVLRQNAALRDEYSAVKRQVGARAADIYEYGAGKNATIQRILEAAGLNEEDRHSIGSNQVPVSPPR
jgi:GrpB-like predicted nucleotidyltransferase (UPF0157 family)